MELAHAAFALVAFLIAELSEIGAVAPDFRKRRLADIAAVQLQIPAGLYLSGALNPYSIAIRKMKKQLKAYPKVPSFKEWSKPADKDDNE